MAYAHDQGHDASKRGLTGSYHQRTYGTVRDDFSHSASPKRDTKVLVHEVKPTDTLQGIALKYDVTVDQVRRLNKLGYSESVQTRTVLDIPCPAGGSSSSPDGGGGTVTREATDAARDLSGYSERSPESILSSADEELEHAKKFVAKLAMKHSIASQPAPLVSSSVRHSAAAAAEGYNRPPPTEESRPDPRSRVTKPTTDTEHAERDKIESHIFEL